MAVKITETTHEFRSKFNREHMMMDGFACSIVCSAVMMIGMNLMTSTKLSSDNRFERNTVSLFRTYTIICRILCIFHGKCVPRTGFEHIRYIIFFFFLASVFSPATKIQMKNNQ